MFTEYKQIQNIYKIQANDPVMCGYVCTEFINFMLKGNFLFSPNKYEKNDKIIQLWINRNSLDGFLCLRNTSKYKIFTEYK